MLGEWTRKGVCECLKYFLCWFFKFPITTVPPLGLKHYLQRPKWKPLTEERHHCFLYQFGGQILYKLVWVAAATKALQSCPTLCDAIDGSPPASPSLGFNLKEKQFKGRKEDGGLKRPKLGVLPWGAKVGWPAGGVSGWLRVSRRTLSSMEVYDTVGKRRAKEDRPSPGLPHCRRILYQLSHKGSKEDRRGLPKTNNWF